MLKVSFKTRFLFALTGNFKYLKKDGVAVKAYRKQISKSIKTRVFRRDNYRCHYCGQSLKGNKNKTIDHFIPYCISRDNSVSNLVTSCQKCNTIKGKINPNTDTEQWTQFLESRACSQDRIRAIEQQLLSNKIDINMFLNSLKTIIKKENKKMFSFGRKTNVHLRAHHSNIWSNIYDDSCINNSYVIGLSEV